MPTLGMAMETMVTVMAMVMAMVMTVTPLTAYQSVTVTPSLWRTSLTRVDDWGARRHTSPSFTWRKRRGRSTPTCSSTCTPALAVV